MKQLILSDEEVQALAEFVDLAVRANGVRVAQAAVSLMQKLSAATEYKPPKAKKKPPPCD